MPQEGSMAWLILAALLGGCFTAAPTPEHEPPSIISVIGTGRVSVKPDTVRVNVGVEARAPALTDATADVSRRMGEVLGRVKAFGVLDPDITTIAYSVDPIVAPRRSDEDGSRILAYRVVNVVQLHIRDVAAVGRIADGAVAAGANTISALQFTLNDPARAESEARTLAVRQAAAKAKEIAAAAGVPLGVVLSIDEAAVPRPLVMRGTAMATAPNGPGPVEAGQLEIVVNVHARYRIGPR